MAERLPVLFVSHGAPDAALGRNDYTRALGVFGQRLSPRAAVVLSAHWEEPQPVHLTGAERTEVFHDFGGFPPELYELRYPAPGDPSLAAEIASLLEKDGVRAVVDRARKLDHGAWVPLRLLYPAADVPVVVLSLPRPRTPELLSRIGEILAPLRERGVLLVGSGGVVHNLARLRFGEKEAPVDDWAREFDEWVARRLAERDFLAILSYRTNAPHASLAVPTPEHFDPIFFVLGAAQPGDRAETLYEGFEYGNLSLRTFALRESGRREE